MPSNVEIKARVTDPDSLQRRLDDITGGIEVIQNQHDTFFHTPYGRLKLRRFPESPAELIYYDRSDAPGPKKSDFRRLFLDDPDYYQKLLSASLGIRGVVEKTRRLYRIGQTRMHLDHVKSLGDFLELEVMLEPGQSTEEGQTVAEKIMDQLKIRKEDLVDAAYIDLLESSDGID
ncbi:MAG: hypothetical protein MAGBODY4_00289 [Candidatus Marinimicrobia bacterium]|nr:hypothetical protein [Candidatus Neomarinimicrobiota bacterium]